MGQSVSETFEFSFAGVATLDARLAVGALSIEPGVDGQARVVVTKKARHSFMGRGDITDDELAEVVIAVEQRGDRIVIDGPRRRSGRSLNNISIEVVATIPARANLELRLAAGQATARGLAGRVAAQVDAGAFEAEDVTFADGSQLNVNAGKVVASGALAAGASMSVEVNAGSVRLELPRTTAVNLDARAQVGALELHGWPVEVRRRFVEQRASGPLAPNAAGELRVRVNAGSAAIIAR